MQLCCCACESRSTAQDVAQRGARHSAGHPNAAHRDHVHRTRTGDLLSIRGQVLFVVHHPRCSMKRRVLEVGGSMWANRLRVPTAPLR